MSSYCGRLCAVQYSKFSFSDLGFIWGESLRDKSLPRILLNLSLKKQPFDRLSGKVMDLGAKSDESSYYRFLEKDRTADLHFCDYFTEGPNLMKIDLEKPFPASLNGFDFILCFNTIEHIFNTDNLISESSRIMKKGGKFIGCVPFLYPFHADPDDYHRYTHSALEKIFEKHGLKMKKIVSVGVGPFVLGFQSTPTPRFLRAIFQSGLFLLDLIGNFYYKKYAGNFSLLYLFEAVKS
jgi:SAM-dependent methyltransferase